MRFSSYVCVRSTSHGSPTTAFLARNFDKKLLVVVACSILPILIHSLLHNTAFINKYDDGGDDDEVARMVEKDHPQMVLPSSPQSPPPVKPYDNGHAEHTDHGRIGRHRPHWDRHSNDDGLRA